MLVAARSDLAACAGLESKKNNPAKIQFSPITLAAMTEADHFWPKANIPFVLFRMKLSVATVLRLREGV